MSTSKQQQPQTQALRGNYDKLRESLSVEMGTPRGSTSSKEERRNGRSTVGFPTYDDVQTPTQASPRSCMSDPSPRETTKPPNAPLSLSQMARKASKHSPRPLSASKPPTPLEEGPRSLPYSPGPARENVQRAQMRYDGSMGSASSNVDMAAGRRAGGGTFPSAGSYRFDVDSALFPLQEDESYFFIGGLRYLDKLIPDHFPLPIEVNLDEASDSPANPPSCCTRFIRTCHRLDSLISYSIHRQSWGIVPDTFILFWAQAFSCWFVPLTFTLSCVFIDTPEAMTLIVAGILTPVTNSSLKSFFVRSRPSIKRLGKKAYDLRTPLKNHSFPSGDSAVAGCWSAGMATATGSFVFWFATPLAMFGRIYFGAHYVFDTLVGASLGIGIFFLTNACNDQIMFEAENDPYMKEWFRRFILFCFIPAFSVSSYYLWLCAKGYRHQ